MKQIAVIAAVFVMTTAFLYADSFLEGNALIGSAQDFPTQGSFVATNAFPANSIVDVKVLSSGRSSRAIVVGRSSIPGVFMVLSPNTAESLAVQADSPVLVRVLPVSMPGMADSSPLTDLPYHPDPDVNPAARVYDPNSEYFAITDLPSAAADPEPEAETAEPEAAPEPEPEPAEAGPPPAEAAPEPEPEPAEAERPEPEPEREPEPEPEPESEPVEEPVEESEPTPALAERPESSLPRPTRRIDEQRLNLESAPVPEIESTPRIELESDETPEAAAAPSGDDSGAIRRPAEQYRRRPDPDERPIVLSRIAPDETSSEYGELPPAGLPEQAELDRGFARLYPDAQDVAADLPAAPLFDDERRITGHLHAPDVPEDEDMEADRPPAEVETRVVLSEEPEEAEPAEPEEAEPADDAPETTEQPAEPADEAPEEEPYIVNGGRSFRLEPAEPRAPEVPDPIDEPEPEPEPEPRVAARADEMLPIVDSLVSDRYYLQIGAFETPAGARAAVDNLGARYPRAVTRAGTETQTVYRVFVGPLNEDEKGSAQLWFRSRGYGDAFVRRAQ